jgi:hypothetical protein
MMSDQLRGELYRMVREDLLGPKDGPHEALDDEHRERGANVRPSDRYLVGMLAPREQRLDPAADEGFALGDDDRGDEGAADTGVSPASNSLFPSSLGLSFTVEGDEEAIAVTAAWGQYARRKAAETDRMVWQRTPRGGEARIALVEGPLAPVRPDAEAPEVEIRGMARRRGRDWVVTLFLVNGQSIERDEENRDGKWLFQVGFTVRGERPSRPAVFVAREHPVPAGEGADDPVIAEERALAMSYRRRREFAVGHGTSTRWTLADDRFDRAVEIATEAMPTAEVAPMLPLDPAKAPPGVDLSDLELGMQELADASDDELTGKLRPLVTAYEAWIEAEASRVAARSDGLGEFTVEANQAIARMRMAAGRIREGIEVLATDARARDAFRFANAAMALQRVRGVLAKRRRRADGANAKPLPELHEEVWAERKNRLWRPFQLGFILLNLPALADPAHPDRNDPSQAIADLLWFPTGGGKTEAYLGLAAFAMAMRRLAPDLGDLDGMRGTSVLMRYTLRLLTLQQFQRATALLCAMEVLRRRAISRGETRWGGPGQRFTIGLWVGSAATPNWTSEARIAIANAMHGGAAGGRGGTPIQLKSCPWCGHELKASDYRSDPAPGGTGRTTAACPGAGCEFTRRAEPDGLPIVLVDEEIYRRPPTMLIATVDKFAQLPWVGATRVLFGKVERECARHGFWAPGIEESNTHPRSRDLPASASDACRPLRPFDLIIQDELHLISGPLGSMTGLYETAIDELSTWEFTPEGAAGPVGVRPKVVASTATVRNAEEQVKQLYARRLAVFPPPGLDAGDNFFAAEPKSERPEERTPGRLYAGVCAPGRSLKVTLIRVYIASMSAAQVLFNRHQRDADAYMTLVGYFNSLRELGGMLRLVQDDVRTRLRQYDRRGLARRLLREGGIRELTSRLNAERIPKLLDQLDVEFTELNSPPPGAPREPRPQPQGPTPVDVLLATNMISVGVDIDRLGLMVVGGQPKNTAEYIQATSRVGRAHPGLVLSVCNWARPRDLSHYERFGHFHAAFYRHVEALSVTPFAERAVDRGLSGIMVALERLPEPGRADDEHAIAAGTAPDLGEHAKRAITRRAEILAGQAEASRIAQGIQHRIDEWRRKATTPTLGYTERGGRQPLLLKPELHEGDFACPQSLRDVEPSSPLVLLTSGTEGFRGEIAAEAEDPQEKPLEEVSP